MCILQEKLFTASHVRRQILTSFRLTFLTLDAKRREWTGARGLNITYRYYKSSVATFPDHLELSVSNGAIIALVITVANAYHCNPAASHV